MAHKLRGIAYNLGAADVGAAAEAIEQALLAGSDLSADDHARLAQAMALTLESQATLAPIVGTSDEVIELDDTERQQLLDKLLQAVSDNNPDALDIADQLLAGMDETDEGHVALTAAREALDMYDFSQATIDLEVLTS